MDKLQCLHRPKRSTGHNSTYPKGGVSCSKDTFVQAESSVLRMKFCGKSPALRVAAKRYASYHETLFNNHHSKFDTCFWL